MGDPWETHGRPMGDPWETHGRPMGDPWETHGRPTGDPWETHGRPMGDHGNPLTPIDAQRKHWANHKKPMMASMGCRYQSTASMGYRCQPMGVHGSPWQPRKDLADKKSQKCRTPGVTLLAFRINNPLPRRRELPMGDSWTPMGGPWTPTNARGSP